MKSERAERPTGQSPVYALRSFGGIRSALLAIVVGCALAVSLFAGSAVRAETEPHPFVGHWEGALSLRGSRLPVRIHVEPDEDALRAALDIPALVMAWEPIPLTLSEGGAPRPEFPFGLGELIVEVKGSKAYAEKAIGEDTLTLKLKRTPPPPMRFEEIRFSSGDTVLAGALVLPPGEGPHPAVVLLHASGRQGMQKWEYRSWADLLVRQGLAVLYYDKRGVGSSGGEYGSNLEQLVSDAVAAVRYLRARPEVNASRVGLRGLSQGAWVAEQTAAELGDTAFLILISGAAGTPRDQEFQKIEYGMRDDGRPEEEIENALAYLGLYFYVARTGEGWSLLDAAVKRAQVEQWGQYVDQPRSQDDLAWWHDNHAFQPAVAVAGLDLPVLSLYGGKDWITPPVENAEKLRNLFPSPAKVRLHVVEGGDHRLEIQSGRDAEGRWHWPGNGARMQDVVADWLGEQGLN